MTFLTITLINKKGREKSDCINRYTSTSQRI